MQICKFFQRFRAHLHTAIVGRLIHKNGHVVFEKDTIVIGEKNMTIGDKVSVGARTTLSTWTDNAQLIIGNNVSIGSDCHITVANRIEIGDGVLLGKMVTITDNSHGDGSLEELSLPPIQRIVFSKGSIRIENNVWIGDKATILPGVCIAEGAVIGANSVVTKDVPPYTIVAGNPATIIKHMK